MTLELDLDASEAIVPTRVVDRPRRTAALPPVSIEADGTVLFVVGPYSVTRALVRAPGAWIVEAFDPNGEQVLLQLAHLRPLLNDAEKALRTHLEQTVLSRTTALLDEPDRVVLAHGGIDRVDGTRVLFWAMPMPDRAERLQNPLKQLDTLDQLLAAGLDLAQRLARRHEIGRFEPLLSEHLFLIDGDGTELIGVPVQVPSEWLANDMPPPRIAPEEASLGYNTIRGDVWRLGQALSVLGCGFEPLPAEVRDLLDRMTSQNATARQPRASEITVELEAVRRTIEGSHHSGEGQATIAMTLALSQDAVTDLMMRAMGESTSIEPQMMIVPEAPVPAWAFFFEPEDYRLFKATMAEVVSRELSDLEKAELARLCRGQASERWALLMRTFLSIESSYRSSALRLPSSSLEEDALFGSAVFATPTISETALSFDEDTLIPPATIVEDALDPAEIAETRMVAPLVFVPDHLPPPQASQESSVEVALPEIDPIDEPSSLEPAVRSRRRWVLGSLGGLALLGAAALAAGRPSDAAVPLDLDRAVVVETGTPNAFIVGEDGTVLGAGPVAISVPREGEVAVLVAAAGHRPERIVLPSGGALRVSLAPLPLKPTSCALDVASGVTVEAIAADLDRSSGAVVRGSAVIRARDGGAVRASIVHCGGSVRIEEPSAVDVGVTIAGDGDLLLDGGKVSGDRITVPAGFHRVTSKGRERWVWMLKPLLLQP